MIDLKTSAGKIPRAGLHWNCRYSECHGAIKVKIKEYPVICGAASEWSPEKPWPYLSSPLQFDRWGMSVRPLPLPTGSMGEVVYKIMSSQKYPCPTPQNLCICNNARQGGIDQLNVRRGNFPGLSGWAM